MPFPILLDHFQKFYFARIQILHGLNEPKKLLHLETVENVKQALTEMYRVLKSPGLLHVVVKAQTGTNKTAVVSDKLSGHDRFFQYFTANELSHLLTTTGFTIAHVKEYSETETIPHGRPEVKLIWCLAQKD